MRRLFGFGLFASIVLLTGLWGARPARAEGWVETDHYRFRVPEGFRELDLGDLPGGDGLEHTLSMIDGMVGSSIDADVSLCLKGPREQPEAVLMAMSLTLRGRAAEATGDHLDPAAIERNVRQGIDRAPPQYGLELLDVRPEQLQGGLQAVEIDLRFDDPASGVPTRLFMLLTSHKGTLCQLMYQTRETGAGADLPWRQTLTSFQLEGRPLWLRLLTAYGVYAAAGLLLLILVLVLRRGRKAEPAWKTVRTPRKAPGSRPSAVTRAVDGLEVYGEGAVQSEEPARGTPPVRTLSRVGASGQEAPAETAFPAAPGTPHPHHTLHAPRPQPVGASIGEPGLLRPAGDPGAHSVHHARLEEGASHTELVRPTPPHTKPPVLSRPQTPRPAGKLLVTRKASEGSGSVHPPASPAPVEPPTDVSRR